MQPAALSALLPASPASPAVARRLLTEWLREDDRAGDVVDDLIFAASEVVSNCVEHAYSGDQPGSITLHATTAHACHHVQVVITVTDTGQWQPPPTDVGHRGRGLSMIAALVEQLHVDPSAHGTRVRITSHPC